MGPDDEDYDDDLPVEPFPDDDEDQDELNG